MTQWQYEVAKVINDFKLDQKPLTVAEIARRLGVSRSTLYRGLGAKRLDAMIASTFDTRYDQHQDYFQDIGKSDGPDTDDE